MITHANVEDVVPLTDSIIQLILKPDEFSPYKAGQYVQIHHEGQIYPFSIANAPLGSHALELHIRHSREKSYNDPVLLAIRQLGRVAIEYPLGDCRVDKFVNDKPIVLIAQGTGFSPIKAVIEQLLADADTRAIHLFWGARLKSDLYLEDRVLQWQSHVAHFNYTSVLSGSGFMHEVVLNNCPNVLNSQVMVAGPFDMAYEARDAFVAAGLEAAFIHSDAFSFEK